MKGKVKIVIDPTSKEITISAKEFDDETFELLKEDVEFEVKEAEKYFLWRTEHDLGASHDRQMGDSRTL